MEESKIFNIDDFNPSESMFIEASAGTGKTYTITEIVNKIVKTGKAELEEILIVTYTDKATGELRSRIRSKLEENKIKVDVEKAAIFTIHSFCQNTLSEFAFLAKQPMNLSLIDESEIDTFIDKWIRDELVNDQMFLDFYTGAKCVNKLKTDLSAAVKNYYLDFNGNENKNIVSMKEVDYPELRGQKLTWDQMIKCRNAKSLNDLEEVFPAFSMALEILKANPDEKINSKTTAQKILDKIHENESNNVSEIYSGNYTPVENPVTEVQKAFLYISELKNFLKDLISDKIPGIFYSHILRQLYLEWQKEKASLKSQSYDDMLRNVVEALRDEKSALKEALKKKYKYAVIDEFQDTNQRQWDIFKSIFLEDKDHSIFVVGDPKQSIYSFQGADLNVYNKAVEEIKQAGGIGTRLPVNYRSSPSMIEACNKIFSSESTFFQDQSFEFKPSLENDFIKESLYMGKALPPVWITEENTDKNAFARIIVKTIIDCCTFTDENKTRLQVYDKKKKSYRNVSFCDFAILSRTSTEMPAVEREMQKVGLPFNRYKDTVLFTGTECYQWICLFKAIVAPDFNGRNRSILSEALFTFFFNIDISETEKEKYDDPVCNERQKIISWQLLSRKREWAKLMETIFKDTEIEKRLSNLDMLQTLSKFRQLANYSVDYLYSRACSLDSLIKHLTRLYNKTESNDTEGLVAKGSDFNCVQLMTIHASKGLEFPVVIVFSGIKGANNKLPQSYFYHENKEAFLGFTSEERKKRLFEESLERQRLYYVAYTRAKSVLILGLLNEMTSRNNKTFYQNIYDPLLNFSKIHKDSCRILEDSPGNWSEKVKEILEMYEEDNADIKDDFSRSQQEEINRELAGKIPEKRILKHSYSSLSHGILEESIDITGEESERLDKDQTVETEKSLFAFDINSKQIPAEYKEEADPVFENFPRGTKLGSAIHEVFEKTDFTAIGNLPDEKSADEDKELSSLIRQSFEKQALHIDMEDSRGWKKTASAIVWNTLNSLLPSISGNSARNENFSLKDLSQEDRLAEVEFNFAPEEEKVFRQYCNGFIDLLFKRNINGKDVYSILDWKSDFMEEEKSYCQGAKLKAATDKAYSIQRVLYSYCTIRWLSQFLNKSEEEVFNENFGGIYYVFVRGCKCGSGNGIYAQTWESWSDLREAFFNISTKLMAGGGKL